MKDRYTDRPNPAASRLAAICFGRENKLLKEFANHLEQKVGAHNISVYMFDGLVVNLLPGGATKADIGTAIDTYNEAADVMVAIKGWPEVD